jgi:hypothetical protein
MPKISDDVSVAIRKVDALAKGPESPMPPEDVRAMDFHEAFQQWMNDTRRPRLAYAWVLLLALVMEIACSLAIVFLLGLGAIHLSQWVADVFFVSVFGQVVGLVHVVLTHLYTPAPFSIPGLYSRLPFRN